MILVFNWVVLIWNVLCGCGVWDLCVHLLVPHVIFCLCLVFGFSVVALGFSFNQFNFCFSLTPGPNLVFTSPVKRPSYFWFPLLIVWVVALATIVPHCHIFNNPQIKEKKVCFIIVTVQSSAKSWVRSQTTSQSEMNKYCLVK